MNEREDGSHTRRSVLGAIGAIAASATTSGPVPVSGRDTPTLVAPPAGPDAPGDRAYEALAAGLERRLFDGDPVSVRRLESHAAVLRAVCRGEISVAAVDPLVAWIATGRDAAETVAAVRHGDAWDHRAVIVVRADATVDDLSELAGEPIALGPLLTLAGSVAPLGSLVNAGCFERDRSPVQVTWRQPGDALTALVTGDVTAAGASDRVIDAVAPARRADLRVLATTPAVPAGPFIVSPTDSGPAAATLRAAIREAVSGSDQDRDTRVDSSAGFDRVREPPAATLDRIDDRWSALGLSAVLE